MPAIRAATEMIRTLASEPWSTEMLISSYICHLRFEVLAGPAYACVEPLATGRRGQLGEPLQRVPRLSRDTVGHLHVDRDDQVTRAPVLAGHALATGAQ